MIFECPVPDTISIVQFIDSIIFTFFIGFFMDNILLLNSTLLCPRQRKRLCLGESINDYPVFLGRNKLNFKFFLVKQVIHLKVICMMANIIGFIIYMYMISYEYKYRTSFWFLSLCEELMNLSVFLHFP